MSGSVTARLSSGGSEIVEAVSWGDGTLFVDDLDDLSARPDVLDELEGACDCVGRGLALEDRLVSVSPMASQPGPRFLSRLENGRGRASWEWPRPRVKAGFSRDNYRHL